MSQQQTFAGLAWKDKGKVTRRERFLAENTLGEVAESIGGVQRVLRVVVAVTQQARCGAECRTHG